MGILLSQRMPDRQTTWPEMTALRKRRTWLNGRQDMLHGMKRRRSLHAGRWLYEHCWISTVASPKRCHILTLLSTRPPTLWGRSSFQWVEIVSMEILQLQCSWWKVDGSCRIASQDQDNPRLIVFIDLLQDVEDWTECRVDFPSLDKVV